MSRTYLLGSRTALMVVLVGSAVWSLGPTRLKESDLQNVWGGDPLLVQVMLHEALPSDISGDLELLMSLKSTAAGERFDLTAFKDDELVDGERLCRIELLAKKTKWRSRIYLYPTLAYAVKSFEVTSPEHGLAWKVHDCTYREIAGVAYHQSGMHISYGGKPDARIPRKEILYEAQSIETDIRKFPEFRSEVKIDPNATYNDVDLKTITTSPEQIQNVLDAIAGLSKMSGDHPVSPSHRRLYAALAGLTVAGLLAIAIVLVWRRQWFQEHYRWDGTALIVGDHPPFWSDALSRFWGILPLAAVGGILFLLSQRVHHRRL